MIVGTGPPAAPRERQVNRAAAGVRPAGGWPAVPNASNFTSCAGGLQWRYLRR